MLDKKRRRKNYRVTLKETREMKFLQSVKKTTAIFEKMRPKTNFYDKSIY